MRARPHYPRKGGAPRPRRGVAGAETLGLPSRQRRGRRTGAGRGVLVREGGGDEAGEQRVRAERLRAELRMELHGEVPGMARELRDLDELAVGRPAGDAEAVLGQRPLVQAVELVAVAMTLVNERPPVNLVRQRA